MVYGHIEDDINLSHKYVLWDNHVKVRKGYPKWGFLVVWVGILRGIWNVK